VILCAESDKWESVDESLSHTVSAASQRIPYSAKFKQP